MHDVTKRGLALAVATGGLLITGAAPAVSVSPHPEHPDHAGSKSQPTGDSSHHTAAISVNESKVKQYAGRHKAPDKAAGRTADEREGRQAALPHRAAAAHQPAAHQPAAHQPAAPHHTAAHHGTATHYPSTAHHAGTEHHPGTAHHTSTAHHPSTQHHHGAPHHPSAAHRPTTAPHHGVPHAGDCPPAPGTCAPAPVPGWVMSPPPVPGHHTHPSHPGHPGSEAASSAQGSDIGGGGMLAGNTVEVPIDAPVNICGVLVTVLDGNDQAADERCVNGPEVAGGPSSSASTVTSGAPGTLSNNVVQAPVSLPANICGDTVTVVGGHDSAEDILCANTGAQSSSTAQATAANSSGLASGNVVQVPVDAPLNLCGVTANVVAAFDTASGTTCVNGGDHTPWMPRHSAGAGADAVTANSTGAVTGNIVQVPVAAPVDVCGDSVNVAGVFNSALHNHCVNHTAGGAAAHGTAVGNNGLAAGNVAQLPVDIPTEVCGVVAAVGGYHDMAVGNTCENTGAPTSVASASTAGETGIVTGNVAQGSVNAPVQVCGTTLGVGIVDSAAEDTYCGTGSASAHVSTDCSCMTTTHQHYRHEHLHRGHHRRPEHEQLSATEEIRRLPHTGADVLPYAGLGAGALVLGAGAVMAGRRRSGSAN